MRKSVLLTRRSLMASTAGALVAAPRLARGQAATDAPVATDRTADALFRELDDRIETAMQRYKVPGVAVGVWWQGAGQRPVQPGNVGGEQQPPGWPLGPAPQGQVVEEAAQVDDGPLADHRRDGLVAGDPAAPGPLVVVGQESLDVLAGELGQAADVRVGGSAPDTV